MGAATSLTGTKKVTLFHLNIQIMKDLKLSPVVFFVVYFTCTFSMMAVCMYIASTSNNSSWLVNTNPLEADLIRNKCGNNIF